MAIQKEELLSSTGFFRLFKNLFNLRADTDGPGTIELIKSNVDFHSASAWTLVFAIFIASVGLNVNSTAVVIGAMLISPLMGPIVGVGLALGIYDFALLRRSARNLLAAVIISVMTSMIYFLLSPLSQVQSELLARTRPSFFDVLIAFFGGAAGIVALSRKEKGNAIPGVAIATALMPPLCTAGFGLATRNFSYFIGAMYLFIINSVFISISTFIFVRYLGFHKSNQIASEHRTSINRWITYVGIAVMIPSFFMAWYLQRESFFKAQANKYISQEFRSDKYFIVDREISYSFKNPTIKVTILGDTIDNGGLEILKQKAKNYSLLPNSIEIRQTSISENLEKKISEKMSAAEDVTKQMQMKLNKSELELANLKNLNTLSSQVSQEITIIFPKIDRVLLIKSQALIQWKKEPTKNEISKATEFLSKRLSVDAKLISSVRGI